MQITAGNNMRLNESADVSERILLHSFPVVSKSYEGVINKQLSYIKKVLPENKHATFFDSIRMPLYTTGIISKVISRNKKIFNGKNPSIHIEGFKEFGEKLKEKILKEAEKVRNEFYHSLYYNSQDILIVNIIDSKPEYQIIPINSVIEIKEYSGQIESIKYKFKLNDKDGTAYIDKETYKAEIGDIKSETPHKLGYCPAIYIEEESIGEIRNGLLLGSLSNLDWILFFAISKRLNDLGGAFPIISVYEENCNYQHEDVECQKGVLVSNINGALLGSDNKPVKCPVCSNRKFMGFGTVLKIQMPDNKEDANLMPPINVTPGDIPSLEYCTKELDRLENNLFKTLTGYEIEIPQALNEKQVQSMFENSKTIINDIARKVERLMNFYYKTIADLTYKVNQIKEVRYLLGTEFYLFNDTELLNMYLELRDKQADISILDYIYLEYLKTKYQNNQTEYEKQRTLFEIDTFRHLTIDQIKLLVIDQIATKEELIYKLRKSELLKESNLDVTDPELKTKLFNLIKINT